MINQNHSALFNPTQQLFNYNKINIILDIDLTLIDSIYDTNTITSIKQVFHKYNDAHKFTVLNHQFAMLERPFSHRILEQLSYFANIYIITQAHSEYAQKIITYLDPKNKYVKKMISRGNESFDKKSIKMLYSNISEIENTLIIDDQVGVWEGSNQMKVLHCAKFDPFFQFLNKKHLMTEYEFYYSDATGKGIVRLSLSQFNPFENNISKSGHLAILVRQLRSMYLEYMLKDFASIQSVYQNRLHKILDGCSFNFIHNVDKPVVDSVSHIIWTLGGKLDICGSSIVLGRITGYVDVYYPAYCYMYLTKLDAKRYIIK